MSGRWFRVYESLAHDPKVQRLPAEMFRGMINLWCLASANEGFIPPAEDIAFVLRMSPSKAGALVAGLVSAGLIDVDDDGRSRPHNWKGRQFNSDVSTTRVKRFRERKKAVSGNADETLHETALEQNREEQKQNRPDSGGADAPAELRFSGDVIRLTEIDFKRWEKAYSAIPDLMAELTKADAFYREKPPSDGKWFFKVSSWLERANKEALERNKPDQKRGLMDGIF